MEELANSGGLDIALNESPSEKEGKSGVRSPSLATSFPQ